MQGDAGGDGEAHDDDEDAGEGEDDLDELLPPPPPPLLLFGPAVSLLFSTAKITCFPPCTFAAGCAPPPVGSSGLPPIEPDALEKLDDMVEPVWLGEPMPGGAGSAIEVAPFIRLLAPVGPVGGAPALK
uniref:Uncharacterized protein n=1 Tax=Anopheles melas TaxID=34690 RepID=A0A182TYN1_9DIPT